jgi:hypothetical protein
LPEIFVLDIGHRREAEKERFPPFLAKGIDSGLEDRGVDARIRFRKAALE